MKHTKFTLIRIAALLLTTTSLISGCSDKEKPAVAQAKAQEYVERAESYRRQGQYRAAIIEARNALQKNPQDRAATLKLANIFNELGQGKAATKLLEAHANDANSEEAVAIAEAFFLQHKYQSTLDYTAEHTQRLGLANNPEAELIKARAQLRLGQIDEAQATLAKLNPSDVPVSLERIHILQASGDTNAIQAELQQLLQLHPDNIEVLSEAALQAERQQKLDQAEDFLSKALMNLPQTDILLPQKVEILQRLVSTLTKLGRSNEALIYAKTLADSNPTGTLLQDKFKQGLELFQAGKHDEAEPILIEVYNESKNDTVGMLLGIIRYAKQDLKGAAKYLGDSIDPEVTPEPALAALAATQLQLAQPEKLLALMDTKDRARIKNPELKMLVGIALLQTGATAEGTKLIQTALDEQPENPAMRATLARFYLANRQADQAITTLEPALKAGADANLSRLLISAYASTNQKEKAFATARALANTSPPQAENWWVLGRTALQLQKQDVAESALRNALSQQPDFLPAQLDLAQMHLQRRQSAEAEGIYRTILKKQPDQVGALRGLLIALVQRGVKDDALRSELLAATTSSNAKAALAEYYLRHQQLDDADQLLASIPKSDVTGYPLQLKQQLIMMRSAQALQAKDYEKARGLIADGLQINPRNPELLVLLARLDLQAKNIDSAKKIAQQLAQTQPRPPQVLELLGDIAMIEADANATTHYRDAWNNMATDGLALKLYQSLSKDPKKANEFLDEWTQRLPNSANAHFLRGVSKQQRGDRTGALADYEITLSRNAKDARALNNMAWLYLELGDKRALATAEQAYILQPENPAVLDTYGLILSKSGQKKLGLEQLQKAHKLAPESKEIEQHLKEATQSH